MIDRKTFKLSIIIPCYNEKNTIEKILKKINLSLINYGFLNYEILVDISIIISKYLDYKLSNDIYY